MQSLGPIISRLDHAYRADEYDKMMAAKLISALFADRREKISGGSYDQQSTA